MLETHSMIIIPHRRKSGGL